MRLRFLLFLPICALFASCEEEPNSTSSDLEEIYNLASEFGDYDEMAHVRYQQFVSEPNQLHYLDYLLKLYITSGKYESAKKLSAYLLDITTTDFRLINAGISNLQTGELSEAQTVLSTLVERVPASLEAHYFLGSVEMQLDEPMKAMEHFTTILSDSSATKTKILVPTERQPQMVVVYAATLNVIGFLEWQGGNREMAIKAWQEAAKADPEFRSPRNNLNSVSEQR